MLIPCVIPCCPRMYISTGFETAPRAAAWTHDWEKILITDSLRGHYMRSAPSVTHPGRWKQGQAVSRGQHLPSTGLDFLLQPFRDCAPGEQICSLWKEMRFPANLRDYSNCVDNAETTMGTLHCLWLKIQPTPWFLRHALLCQRFLNLHSRGSQFWPHIRNTWGGF